MIEGDALVEFKIRYKYVVEDVDRHGNVRLYYREKGKTKVRLKAIPGTPEFDAEYQKTKANVGPSGRAGPRPSKPHSLRWLCEQYFGSAEYKGLDARTRQVRRQILEHIWDEPLTPESSDRMGDCPLAHFNARHVRVLRDRKAEFPEAADARVKALRRVFSYGCDAEPDHVLANPARDVSYLKRHSDGHHSWTVDEVLWYQKAHPIGTRAHLALALLLWTGQRRSDIVKLGRQHEKSGELTFTQTKNQNRKPVRLTIPIRPELRAAIDATPTRGLTYLETEFGRPFTSNGFGNRFRKWCDDAGLGHCSAHGLRKAAAAMLAEAGASEHEIMSITGHATSKEIARYTKGARQKVLARGAFSRLPDGTADEQKCPTSAPLSVPPKIRKGKSNG